MLHKLHFYPAVRAYKRGKRIYFVNTYTGSWASLPIHYVRMILTEDKGQMTNVEFKQVYEALAKALIIRDPHYRQERVNEEVKPLLVKLQTTGKCNLQCIYCFNDTSIRTHSMNMDTMRCAIDYALENPYSVNGVYFSIYGGEPLMERPLLYETISYIRKKSHNDLNVNINIITNGSLLTDSDLSFLKENKVQISISFDGLLEFQNINRKGNSNDLAGKITLENIKKLNTYHRFNVLSTITRDMSDKLLEIALFMEEQGIPSVEFLPLRMLGKAEGRKDISVDVRGYVSSMKEIVEAIEQGKIKNLKIRALLRMLMPLETGQTLHGDLGCYRCGSGRNVISINYDGTITGCDMIPPEFSPVIGNVWDGITHLEQLDQKLLPYGKISDHCIRCPWSLFCRSGCTGASGSDEMSCNTRHTLTCAINKELYPYLLEKLVTDGGILHEYFITHTNPK